MNRLLNSLAAWVSRGWGNRNQAEDQTSAHPPRSATTDLRSYAITTSNKILGAWRGRQFKRKLKDTFDCELTDCCIDLKEWLDPLTSDNLEPSVDSLINLEPLRRQLADGVFVGPRTNAPNDCFLPPLIFVREEMKGIFKLFCRDVDLLRHTSNLEDEAVPKKNSCVVLPYDQKTILIGSPGVGKSILFFLAALYRAQCTVTIYIRQSNVQGEDVSLFVMFPEDDETDSGKVRVLFTRHLKNQYLTTGLFGLKAFLEKSLQLEREEYYLFLDGPRFNPANLRDTLNGEFDFLCTSAGYPDFKSEEYGNSRCWIMCGWTKEEAEAAFVQLRRTTTTDIDEIKCKAREAYALCGGKIRDMFRAFDDHESMQNSLMEIVDNLQKDQVELSLYSKSRSKMNKIRIVFRRNREDFANSRVTQYVDSKFLRTVLAQRLDLERFVNDYKLALSMENPAVAGWHLESTVHAWFSELVAGNQGYPYIETVSDISNASNHGGGQLIKKEKQYWVPPSRYFRNIDSAVVIDHTLYAFQITVCGNHTFQVRTFFDDFLETMIAFGITSVQVCVITTQKGLLIDAFLKLVTKKVRSHSTPRDGLKHFGDLKNVPRDGWLHIVDMDDTSRFRQSMNGLLAKIKEHEDLKKPTAPPAILEGSNASICKSKDRKRKASTTPIPGDAGNRSSLRRSVRSKHSM